MSNMIKLVGKILDGPVQRDAFHMAACSVKTSEYLSPGEWVKFKHGSKTEVIRSSRENAIGILDPFINLGEDYGSFIPKDSWVLMFLMPETVTGMTHHWAHPVLDAPIKSLYEYSDEERWLLDFANKYNFDYDEMLKIAERGDDYIIAHEIDIHSAKDLDVGEEKEFWKNIEIVLGKKFSETHKESVGWSCAC